MITRENNNKFVAINWFIIWIVRREFPNFRSSIGFPNSSIFRKSEIKILHNEVINWNLVDNLFELVFTDSLVFIFTCIHNEYLSLMIFFPVADRLASLQHHCIYQNYFFNKKCLVSDFVKWITVTGNLQSRGWIKKDVIFNICLLVLIFFQTLQAAHFKSALLHL